MSVEKSVNCKEKIPDQDKTDIVWDKSEVNIQYLDSMIRRWIVQAADHHMLAASAALIASKYFIWYLS